MVQLCEDEGEKYPLVAKIVRDVDDISSGANTPEEAIECLHQLQGLLGLGGFPIHKWSSNEPKVMEQIPESDREKLIDLDGLTGGVVKVLVSRSHEERTAWRNQTTGREWWSYSRRRMHHR